MPKVRFSRGLVSTPTLTAPPPANEGACCRRKQGCTYAPRLTSTIRERGAKRKKRVERVVVEDRREDKRTHPVALRHQCQVKQLSHCNQPSTCASLLPLQTATSDPFHTSQALTLSGVLVECNSWLYHIAELKLLIW